MADTATPNHGQEKLSQNRQTHMQSKANAILYAGYPPDSAEHLGPPLRSGYGDRGHRTDPSPRHTLGYGSWFWCRLFSGGTGDKWIPENKGKSLHRQTRQFEKQTQEVF